MNILVVAGFLGAGKTTLLLRLARWLIEHDGRRVAIIENEAGKVGVDDQFIADQGLDVREIFGGCVCCSLGVNLLLTLKQLEADHNIDTVIVEPSGVAAPDMVRQLLAGYDGAIESTRIMVVFDTQRFGALSHVARPYMEASINAADVIVINKIDTAGPGHVADLVDHIHQRRPEVKIVAISAHRGTHFNKLIAALTDAPATNHDKPHDHHHPHGHAGDPVAEARQTQMTFDPPIAGSALADRISDAIAHLTATIAAQPGVLVGHVKGILRCHGHMLLCRATGTDQPPSRDGQLPDQVSSATLTVNAIAYGIDQPTLAALLRAMNC